MSKIVTWNPYPPIPIRTMDWAAYYEGMEESGEYGWGRTEEEAIADLKANFDDPDEIDAAQQWEREAVERMNYDMRRS